MTEAPSGTTAEEALAAAAAALTSVPRPDTSDRLAELEGGPAASPARIYDYLLGGCFL